MRELNKLELEEVNGGFGPAGAGFGALVGAVGYLGGLPRRETLVGVDWLQLLAQEH